MKQRKPHHRRYGFLGGILLVLAISTAISAHAVAPSHAAGLNLNDSLIKDRAPIVPNEPLYVIDGYPLPSKFVSALNPDYIESMEILRDASATAVYGSRGANGVFIITLKSPEKVKEEKTSRHIDNFLKSRGVDSRNMRYYIDGKEVPASVAFQTNIEQMDVRTGADGKLEIYIKPILMIKGEFE